MSVKGNKNRRPVVIKREEVVEHGHHGGAWKVAYADFVTAMMAFFLLMWLLNATTEAQRKGLADYFTPTNALSHASSGSGAPFGGKTPYDDGELVSDRGAMALIPGKSPQSPHADEEDADQSQPRPMHVVDAAEGGGVTDTAGAKPHEDGPQAAGGGVAALTVKNPARAEFLANAGAGANPRDARAADVAALKTELERREREAFERAAEQIREAVRLDPKLADLARQIAIDQTPDGLRIQLLDEDKQPMFSTGSAVLLDRAKLVLQKIAPTLVRMKQSVSISGHTDAAPYRGGERTNWELSSERANATRRLLVDAGLDENRLRSVTGNADKDLLLPADPLAAANRRISILVLRDAPPRSTR